MAPLPAHLSPDHLPSDHLPSDHLPSDHLSVLWHISLFGTICLHGALGDLFRFRTRKTGFLLAYLAHSCPQRHSREELINLFWPDSSLCLGRNSLRVTLCWLRQNLEGTDYRGQVLLLEGDSIALNPALIQTDTQYFEAALSLATSQMVPEARIQALGQAVQLYEGDFLPGLEQTWAILERQRLQMLYLESLGELSHLLIEQGQWHQALVWGQSALQLDPYYERAAQAVIKGYLGLQRPNLAQDQYRSLVAHLAELSCRPSWETDRLLSGYC
jgi:DNA-binding SARP family transcriptional activator